MIERPSSRVPSGSNNAVRRCGSCSVPRTGRLEFLEASEVERAVAGATNTSPQVEFRGPERAGRTARRARSERSGPSLRRTTGSLSPVRQLRVAEDQRADVDRREPAQVQGRGAAVREHAPDQDALADTGQKTAAPSRRGGDTDQANASADGKAPTEFERDGGTRPRDSEVSARGRRRSSWPERPEAPVRASVQARLSLQGATQLVRIGTVRNTEKIANVCR